MTCMIQEDSRGDYRTDGGDQYSRVPGTEGGDQYSRVPGGDQYSRVPGGDQYSKVPHSDDTRTFDILEKLVERGLEDEVSQDDMGRRFRNAGGRVEVKTNWRGQSEEKRYLGSEQHSDKNENGRNLQQHFNQNLENIRNGLLSMDKPKLNVNTVNQNQHSAQSNQNQDNSRNQPNLLFTPNGQEHGSNAVKMNQLPQQIVQNSNDGFKTQHTTATSPPKPSLSSLSQPNLVSSSNPSTPQTPSLPPDLIQVLSWQNDQLRQLQKQVEILLQSPARQQATTTTTTAAETPKTTCTAGTMTSMLWPDLEAAMAKLAAATETPDPPTALDMNSSSRSESPQPSLHLDMPDYTPSEVSPPQGGNGRRTPPQGGNGRRGKGMVDMKDIDSPVLGESVSMYESSGESGENPQELYNNILGQVRRMLDVDKDPLSPIAEQLTPTEENSTQPSQSSRSQESLTTSTPPVFPTRQSPPPPPVDPAIATLERLRSLGISFISPADLSPANPSTQPSGSKYNSVYLPTASNPSMSIFNGPSPDTSLDTFVTNQ